MTQEFQSEYSAHLGCILTDSPGLGDRNIPMSQWLNLYNDFQKTQPNVDLVLVVVEGKNRVNIADVQVFSILDAALKNIKAENIAIVFNKCGE